MNKTSKLLVVLLSLGSLQVVAQEKQFTNAKQAPGYLEQAKGVGSDLISQAQQKLLTPALHYIEGQGGMKNISYNVMSRAWQFTEENGRHYGSLALSSIQELSKQMQNLPHPSKLLTVEEKATFEHTLETAKDKAAALNTKAADMFGLPEDIMGGILIAITMLGIKVSLPAIASAIPLLPYAVEYGAIAGGTYTGYKIVSPYLPYVPALAAGFDVTEALTSIKDSLVAANEKLAKRFSLSPYLTGGAATALTAAGTSWAYNSLKSLLWWGRAGVYLSLGWPLLSYTYSFASEAYARVQKYNLSLEEAQALADEADRLVEQSQAAITTIEKEFKA